MIFFLVSDIIEVLVNEKRSFEPREIGRQIGIFFFCSRCLRAKNPGHLIPLLIGRLILISCSLSSLYITLSGPILRDRCFVQSPIRF